jgi:hypothetical protein
MLPGAAPAAPAGADTEAMQRRLKELEAELKSRPDARQATNIARLEQLRERARQLQEANRADQSRIFDTYRKQGAASDPKARSELSREVGNIQMQIARRGQEQRTLGEEIAKLESELGVAAQEGRK